MLILNSELAENPATHQANLLRWFLFFLCNTEAALSVCERDDMLNTYQNLSWTIDEAKKEVSHV